MNSSNESYRTSQIEALRSALDNAKLSSGDIRFGSSLCDAFYTKGSLSDKQWYWVGVLLKRAGADYGSNQPTADTTEEVFDGTKVRDLLLNASKKLLHPQLRYQTDGGSKIVFSYANEGKWTGSTFLSNGARGENKARYGFIDSHGAGRLNRESKQETKTLIRKIAADPAGIAKLQGQKYTYCVFCGLGLVNKSSVHHGYGPICADNYGLPWGETGDQADEEEAAKAELKHIQLQDLE